MLCKLVQIHSNSYPNHTFKGPPAPSPPSVAKIVPILPPPQSGPNSMYDKNADRIFRNAHPLNQSGGKIE